MPKASFASKDTYEPKLGFQEGWFEIVDAKTQVFQYPPNKDSGDQSPPFLAAVLSFQRTDEQGKPLDEEPQEKVLRIEKDLSKMRPGEASSRDDDDPSDLGDEIDTEGNCVYTEEGVKINANTSYAVFFHSLEEKGFKAEILGAGYMPDLIGTKGHASTAKGEKRSIGGRDVEPSYLVVDKVTVKPYEATAKKGPQRATKADTKAAAPKVNGAVNGAVKPAAKPAKAPVDTADAEALATQILTELAADLRGETRDSKKLYAMAYSRLVKEKDRDRTQDKVVQDLLRNEDWLAQTGAELDLWAYDNGVFTFPSDDATAA